MLILLNSFSSAYEIGKNITQTQFDNLDFTGSMMNFSYDGFSFDWENLEFSFIYSYTTLRQLDLEKSTDWTVVREYNDDYRLSYFMALTLPKSYIKQQIIKSMKKTRDNELYLLEESKTKSISPIDFSDITISQKDLNE